MIKRIQARIFCLARGLKVLNLSVLFLLPTQIGLVTRQLKCLISFANSYILIEAASVHDQCCQYKHSPTPNLCWAVGLTTSFLLQKNTIYTLRFCLFDFCVLEKGMSLLELFILKIFATCLWHPKPSLNLWFTMANQAHRSSSHHQEGKLILNSTEREPSVPQMGGG